MQKSHKLKSMNVQKNSSLVPNVLVSSKTEEVQDDTDYSGLARGEYYIDDIIRYTMEIENKEKKMQQEKLVKLQKKHENDILLQQEEEKLKFNQANVEEVKKEDTQNTGFFGNAIGKIKQKFFGNDEVEGSEEEEEGEYEQSEELEN